MTQESETLEIQACCPSESSHDNCCTHEQVSRVGLEPTTSGLTYRTGFHPPSPSALRSGLYHLPRPDRWGAAREVSEDSGQSRSFLLIAQSDGLSRTRCVPSALRVFQQMERFYLESLNPGTP